MTDRKQEVQFTAAQMRWLESQFPERVLPCTEPESALREYFGERKVLLSIRRRVQDAHAL